jgi:hypothetical protein
MMKYNVRTLEEAYAYTTDCLLATVSDMAMKKSRPKGEYARHISIAQTACDFLKEFHVIIEGPTDWSKGSRAYEVMSAPTQSVADWAKKYEPKES